MHITRPLTLLSLLTLSACTQSYSHAGNLALSPDGNTLALLRPERPSAITLLNLNTGTASDVPLPSGHAAEIFLWLDARFYVATRDIPDAPAYLYTPDKKSWTSAPNVMSIWYPLYPATYKQSPVLLQTSDGTKVLSAKDLTPIDTLPDAYRGLRDGYLLRYHWPEEDGPRGLSSGGQVWDFRTKSPPPNRPAMPTLSQIELLDPDFKVVMSLTRENAAAQGYSLIDNQSQLSPDHHTLMFAPENQSGGGSGNADTIWSFHAQGFTVLDVSTGKLLYKVPGRITAPESTGMGRGTLVAAPILTNDAVYAIEEFLPPLAQRADPTAPPRTPGVKDHQLWLYRFTATTADPVLQLPIEPLKFFSAHSPQTTTPDATSLLIYTATPAPHILKIPVRKNTTPADIQSFNL